MQEEKDVYNIYLLSTGGATTNVIKVIREFTGLGLKEAKELAGKLPAGGRVLKENVHVSEARAFAAQLETVGATVELR